ncbi:MAG: hypothetical protein WC728_16875 [Elusimicrobiota bacterium]
MAILPEDSVILALDSPPPFQRRYFLLADGKPEALRIEELASKGNVHVVLYPTRTYAEGFGGDLFSDIAPEDRRLIRGLQRRFPDRVECHKVRLKDTVLFEKPGYFSGEEERKKYEAQKSAAPVAASVEKAESLKWLNFNPKYLVNMKEIFVSCMTRPNKQDYMWLWTKTFGLNLVIRLAFVVKGVKSGQLPLLRAVFSTLWYQIQDAVFTVFGQTYMKFLGKMTGLLRIRGAYFGDFLFVYIQLCGCEFLNRLVLGPLGENPLVYTWQGVGLIFINILQGMLSGGPITPAINKMRKSGLISHEWMMHLYQAASLTMHFGLFASFGYQRFYAILTGVVLVLAWSGYIILTTFFNDPEFSELGGGDFSRLDEAAGRVSPDPRTRP